jgi:nicotinate-nucleotide adenylyltransferase
LCLILGADCLPDLASWHEPARIVAQAELLVIARPGWETWSAERLRSALALPANQPLSMTIVESPALGIASRELRARVRAGRTIRYLVPRAVECYIETHRLYTGGE